MSSSIELDMLIEWQAAVDGAPASEPRRVERVLWLDAERQTVITIDIFAHDAMPTLCLHDDLIRELTSGAARILTADPYAELRRRDQDITTSQRQRRDETWRVLGPLIAEHNVDLLAHSNMRGLLIRECAARAGLSKAVIYKYLRRYWQAGRTPNALLPAFDKCGGRGKRRHPKTGTQDAAKLGRPSARAVNSGRSLGIRITPEAEQYVIQGALAASEGWSYEQYLQRLCDLELQQRESRKRQRLLLAARLPREKTLENFERQRLKRNVERQFTGLLSGEFLQRAENVLVFGSPGGGKTHRHNYSPKSRR
jgi:hypothetical protein